MNNNIAEATEWVEWAKVIVPIGAAVIVILGGFFTYAYQRGIDRRDKLREKKQAAYEAYLHMLYAAAMERNRYIAVSQARAAQGTPIAPNELFADERANDRFQETKLTVFVMASDTVIRAAGKYQKLVQSSGNSGESMRQAFAEMIRAMREDSFESSSLRIEEIIELSPLNHNSN